MKSETPDIYKWPLIPTERPDYYRPGKFAPIYLGDVLNEIYKIFRKLGYGSQSTIWLAKDILHNRYVAVKVYSAEDKLQLVDRIFHDNVEAVLDHFTITSVNGSHLCTVLEPLGRCLTDIIDQKLDAQRGRSESSEDHQKYDPHILLGLDSLHSQQIVHRDIQPANIAFALSFELDTMSMDENSKRHIAWIERHDGQPLKSHEIQYAVCPSLLHDRILFDDMPRFRLCLIDLGFSQPFDDCDPKLFGPHNYRSPETILPIPVTYKADIFTAGIVFWEVVTTRNLVWSHYHKGKVDDNQYLRDLITRLGPMPEHFEKLFPLTDEDYEAPLDEEDFHYGDLQFAARRDGPEDMTDHERDAFVDLITQMLQWEPEKRPTTKELLKYPFFEL
ncbi:hypothetical protein ANO11243_091550 [Dothideomycetidae sp. 11243]|nr:hypothetical protein ANO11243_091550 [fungal sp. No.11243]